MWFTPGHLYNVYAKLWSMVCNAILDKFYIDQSSDRLYMKRVFFSINLNTEIWIKQWEIAVCLN